MPAPSQSEAESKRKKTTSKQAELKKTGPFREK
jgi:hypothetical protein